MFMTRATLTDREIAYLSSQYLGRIATVDARGRPHVVPTGFAVNREQGTIELGGFNFHQLRRVRDIRTNPHVALVVDDVEDPSMWTARGVEIRGVATLHDGDERSILGDNVTADGWMHITPTSTRSWGLDEE
jgi:PPOX class F420-dependent enzyme/OxyR family protein